MSKARALVFALIVASTGCISYVPMELSEVQPQDKVRLQLERNELAKLIAFADPLEGTVTGRYISGTADSIDIVVQSPASYTQVSIPRRSVLSTDLRVVDNRKSFMISAVIVGTVAAIAVKGFEGRDGGPPGDGEPGDATVIPLFGFRIPFSLGFGR